MFHGKNCTSVVTSEEIISPEEFFSCENVFSIATKGQDLNSRKTASKSQFLSDGGSQCHQELNEQDSTQLSLHIFVFFFCFLPQNIEVEKTLSNCFWKPVLSWLCGYKRLAYLNGDDIVLYLNFGSSYRYLCVGWKGIELYMQVVVMSIFWFWYCTIVT